MCRLAGPGARSGGLRRPRFRAKERPSGHIAKATWAKDSGGAIPGNVLTFGNNDSNGRYLTACKNERLKPHPARFPVFLPESSSSSS